MCDSEYRWVEVAPGRQKLVKIGEEPDTRRRKAPGAGWPMTCYASGVHEDQAGDLRKYLADRGCPTEVTPHGDPVYRSAAHRRQALRLRGMHDRASFD